ncbi:MAG: FAD-binding oxidoreductase, partial [Alphaproteobacteria bacterium]|nr:FAD-binding oxidoreductase [Alphaproteobacteria bacterium]
MTHPLVTDLQGVLGDTGVLIGPSDMAAYLTDWTGEFTGTALCVARPASTKEVQQVVILCARHDVAITPQGGNTCVSGGSVPATDRTQIVLSLDRMRKIRALDTTARTATVEAGVILE